MLYEIYVTDALGIIAANTARYAGGQMLNTRYYDMVKGTDNEPQRTSEDIIKSISEQLGQIGKEENDGSI